LPRTGFVHRNDGVGSGEDAAADGAWQWTNESYPADAVSLRSISSDNFVIVDSTHGADVIGETSFNSGPSTLHEKAIYLLEGALYQVERLDFEGRKAYVRQIDCDYYTDAITYTKVTPLETFEIEPPNRAHGEVHVSSRVVGFKKIKFYTNENVGSGELDLPEQQMHTTAYWLTIPQPGDGGAAVRADDRPRRRGGLSFAMRQVAQLLLDVRSPGHRRVDRQRRAGDEVDPRSAPISLPDEPRIFIYDNYPGGIGFSQPLFAMHADLLRRTRDVIASCACEHGCPTCVGPSATPGPLAKLVALRILIGLSQPSLTSTPSRSPQSWPHSDDLAQGSPPRRHQAGRRS
jgi:DEAD/DEAH box helicase domain-containing protein